jgi:hypothetical protein
VQTANIRVLSKLLSAPFPPFRVSVRTESVTPPPFQSASTASSAPTRCTASTSRRSTSRPTGLRPGKRLPPPSPLSFPQEPEADSAANRHSLHVFPFDAQIANGLKVRSPTVHMRRSLSRKPNQPTRIIEGDLSRTVDGWHGCSPRRRHSDEGLGLRPPCHLPFASRHLRLAWIRLLQKQLHRL